MIDNYLDFANLEQYVQFFKNEFDLSKTLDHCLNRTVEDGFEAYPNEHGVTYIIDLYEKFNVPYATHELFSLTTSSSFPGLVYSSVALISPVSSLVDRRSEIDLRGIAYSVQGTLTINKQVLVQGSYMSTKDTTIKIDNSSSHWAVCLFFDIKSNRFT